MAKTTCLRKNVKSGQAGSDSSLKHLSHLPQFVVQKIAETKVMFFCLVALDGFLFHIRGEAGEDIDCWCKLCYFLTDYLGYLDPVN